MRKGKSWWRLSFFFFLSLSRTKNLLCFTVLLVFLSTGRMEMRVLRSRWLQEELLSGIISYWLLILTSICITLRCRLSIKLMRKRIWKKAALQSGSVLRWVSVLRVQSHQSNILNGCLQAGQWTYGDQCFQEKKFSWRFMFCSVVMRSLTRKSFEFGEKFMYLDGFPFFFF